MDTGIVINARETGGIVKSVRAWERRLKSPQRDEQDSCDHSAPPYASMTGLEELDEIAGRVDQQDLGPARATHDVIAEVRAPGP